MAKKKKKAKRGNENIPPAKAAGVREQRDISQLDSPSFRVFSGLVVIFFLAGMLASNDLIVIWSGAEAWNLWQALSDQPSGWLTSFLQAVYDDGPISLFYLRFFGIFFFLIALILSIYIGRQLFGKNTIWLAALLLAASLLVPNLAKRASTDIYLFSSQMVFGMGTLLLLKRPLLLWWSTSLIGLFCSFFLEPLGSLLFAFPFLLLLLRSHSGAAHLGNWKWWATLVAGLGILALLRPVPWLDKGISLGWMRSGYLYYLGWQLIAVLPFLGFVAGGLRDLFYKLRKKEEFSLVLAAWILSALLSQSPTLSWVLALLAARHMQLCFDPKYPFLPWVRGAAILQLVLVFFALTTAMVLAFWAFGVEGFRSLLMVSGLYWGISFLGVIGLYGFNHRLLIGGPVLAGVLAVLLFWLQVWPLIESKRRWAPEMVERAKSRQDEGRQGSLQLYYPPGKEPFPSMAAYGLDRIGKVSLLSTEEALSAAATENQGLLVLEKSIVEQLPIPAGTDTLSGWNDRLQAVQYRLIVPD